MLYDPKKDRITRSFASRLRKANKKAKMRLQGNHPRLKAIKAGNCFIDIAADAECKEWLIQNAGPLLTTYQYAFCVHQG